MAPSLSLCTSPLFDPPSPSCTMKTNTPKSIALFALTTWAGTAFGHEGHLMTGTHWHATDAWGFVALGGLIALAIWFSNDDK